MENIFDSFELPIEVKSSSHALVGMVGLDIASNPLHRVIWDTFVLNRRPERASLKFQQLREDFELPTPKGKRQSYEWYVPKGILKSNWLSKYLNEIPAVITIFFDLDWNDPDWIDKKNIIAETVQSIRNKSEQRNCRIALVLIQNETSVPGEDTVAAEKASILCTTCNISSKLLYLLPHADTHLLGHIIRLENVLAEIAGGFYLGEVKNIKTHRNFLNKTTHLLLFVRHEFKIGFHNEMRGDYSTAVKNYLQAYAHLIELRCTNTNLHEIRICAAIINFKICRLDFVLNLPRDAIAQFRRHIDMFRQKTGPKELIFEHYAWLAKQYKIFGDIFEEAVSSGLPAVQTQHPGFYYQQAAQYSVTRRNTTNEICSGMESTSLDLLDGWNNIEFYGQRPWRPGKHLLEPPEAEREADGVKALQYHDYEIFKHSEQIIPLFSSAISQFKKYRCPRIKRHLMVMMADEYFNSKDPGKALALLNHVMWDYRHERWWTLLSSASSLALKCAFLTSSISDYLLLSFEVLGPRVHVNSEDKLRVYNNIQKVLAFNVPDVEPDTPEDISTNASEAWGTLLRGNLNPVQLDMNTIVPCIQLRCTFMQSSVHIDQKVEIKILIRNLYSEDLHFSGLSVITNVPSYNSNLNISDSSSSLLLKPNQVYTHELHFTPDISDVGKCIKINQVVLHITGPDRLAVNLTWTGVGCDGVSLHSSDVLPFNEFKTLCKDPFDVLKIIPEVIISSHEPNIEVKVDCDKKALVWEWLPVEFNIINNEMANLSDVVISLELHPTSEVALLQTTQITASLSDDSKQRSHQPTCQARLPIIPLNGSHSTVMFIKSLTPAPRSFVVKITYQTNVKINDKPVVCPSVFQDSFEINASIPFTVNIETQSLKFEQVTNVSNNESFLVVPKIICSSHTPILFTSSSLALHSSIEATCDGQSKVEDVELQDGESGLDCFAIKAKSIITDNLHLPLGQYLLKWQRVNARGAPAVSVSVGLPSITVQLNNIWVEADLPAQGIERSPLMLNYTLMNKGSTSTEVTITMQVSNAFMFAGHKEVRFRILPDQNETVTYMLYPLLAGTVQLPKLILSTDPPSNVNYESLLERILPTHMYIMPQVKPTNTASEDISDNLISQAA